ncbi:hypothetical protein L1887_24120 [Cichorium endivia]|nr:hypothetical protein L1887_24120 [Cichorium endivia]
MAQPNNELTTLSERKIDKEEYLQHACEGSYLLLADFDCANRLLSSFVIQESEGHSKCNLRFVALHWSLCILSWNVISIENQNVHLLKEHNHRTMHRYTIAPPTIPPIFDSGNDYSPYFQLVDIVVWKPSFFGCLASVLLNW